MKNIKWRKNISVFLMAVCMIITAVLTVSAASDTEVTVGTPVAITDGVVSQFFSDVSAYRQSGGYTAPSAPSGYSNYVFAGWFKCEQCGNETGHTTETGHTYLDCPIETNTTGGKAYAKFVIKDVFSVKAQFLAGTNYDTEQSDMRFVTTVDSLDYDKVGFKCEFNDVTKTAESDTVYQKLYAAFRKSDGEQVVSTLLPTAFSETTSKYFMAGVLKDIPNADFGDAIEVTPYWVTLDGTTVYGDTVMKTVNNGYVEIAKGVTVVDKAVIDYSNWRDVFKNVDETVSNTSVSIWSQGGCIGVDAGKAYYYQAMVSSGDNVNRYSYILKIDMSTGKPIACSQNLNLGHTNDITYNKDLDVLVVCQNASNYERISFVDPGDLTLVNPSKIQEELTFGDGVTVEDTYITTSHKETKDIFGIFETTQNVENELYSLEYNSYHQKYVVGINGGQTFRILNADFSDPNASGDAFSMTENTAEFVAQTAVADDSYIYFIFYNKTGSVTSYEGHVIAVYDWDGNYVTVLEIPKTSIPVSLEPENLAIYDNVMYISCANTDGNGGREIYKVATFDISEAEFEAKIENYYSSEEQTDPTGYFQTLEKAVEAANKVGGSEAVTIKITSPNVSVSKSLSITRANVTIMNEEGVNVIVKRGADFSGSLISIGNSADGVKITSAETGSLTFEGNDYTGSSLVSAKADLTISNVKFKNLEANSKGGVVNVKTGTTTIADCIFENNTTTVQGGAIFVTEGATANVSDSTFTGNKTVNYSGGAIRSEGTLTVDGSTFTKNKSASVGGAVIGNGTGSDLIFTDCVFKSNTSNTDGGAIEATGGCKVTLTVTDGGTGTFFNNSATGIGGAIHTNNSALSVIGYQFYGNTATGNGGAINIGGSNTIENVSDTVIILSGNTFAGNTSGGNGGAVYNSTRTIDVQSCTFGQDVTNDEGTTTQEGNTATGNGGAIYNAAKGTTTLSGTGSFAYNTAKCELAVTETDEGTTDPNYGGGAICIGSGTLNVTGYTFTGNSVTNNDGGAIKLNSGSATITSSTFGNEDGTGGNSAVSGGAIRVAYGNIPVTIKNSTFFSNIATNAAENGTANGGGAIMSSTTNEDTGLTIENSTFVGNKATGKNGVGGAICGPSKIMDINDCNFGGETAEDGNTAYQGGAIYGGWNCHLSVTTTANNYFKNNSTVDGSGNQYGGAIAMGDKGALTINGYTFSDNRSSFGGGAVYLADKAISLNITGTTSFTENSAQYGGAIFSNSISTDGLKITGTTFESNTASTSGGGIFVGVNNTAPLTIEGNSAFTSNVGTDNGGAIGMSASNKNAVTLTIDTTTFTGNSTKTDAEAYGGAIRLPAIHVTATISNCTFTSNESYTGGAICNEAALTINSSTFVSNNAATNGGAVLGQSSGSSLTITDSNFTSNSTTKGVGGAVLVLDGCTANITVTENGTGTFKSNTATGDGGAIRMYNSALTVTGYTFEENNATGNGGAVSIGNGNTHEDISDQDVVMSNNTFTKNTASNNGAAIHNFKRTVDVQNGTFNENTATGHGGAIYNDENGVIQLTGTGTFASNTVSDAEGGAIYIATGTLNVEGYSFTGNSALSGGAIRVAWADIPVTIKDSIFSSNTATHAKESGTTYGGGAIMSATTNTTKGLEINSSTFKSNKAIGKNGIGGAICCANKVSITDCDFGGETADDGNTAYHGGAIYAGYTGNDCDLSVTATGEHYFKNNSTVSGSNNQCGGAIAVGGPGTLTISNYEFEKNTSNFAGGAIHLLNKEIPLTITNASFTSNSAPNGGAIFSNSISTDGLKITGTRFESNTASTSGGGIFVGVNNTAPLTIEGNSAFTSNVGTDNGGAIGMSASNKNAVTLTIDTTTFTGNSTKTDAEAYGGAIRLPAIHVTATISKCNFTSNKSYSGGAIENESTNTLTISSSTFEQNTASFKGGALYDIGTDATNGTVVKENCTFTDNQSVNVGGALYSNNPKMTISGTNFTGNKSNKAGGAIHIAGGTLSATRSDFNKNSAKNTGGAVRIDVGTFNATDCDFIENSATSNVTSNGGAIAASNQTTPPTITITVSEGNEGKYQFKGNTTGKYAGGAIWVQYINTLSIYGYKFVDNASYNKKGNVLLMATGCTGTVSLEQCTELTETTLTSVTGRESDVLKQAGTFKQSNYLTE